MKCIFALEICVNYNTNDDLMQRTSGTTSDVFGDADYYREIVAQEMGL